MRFFFLFFLALQTWPATAKIDITISGFGGNDVVTIDFLINDILKEDLDALGVNLSYNPIESDYPKYILNGLSSGNAPDAFYVAAELADAWMSLGILLPLDKKFFPHIDSFNSHLLDIYSHNGNIYGLPKDLNSLGLVYNIDIFDDANVPYPTDDDDWFDFHNKLKAVVQNIGDEGVVGICLSSEWNRFAPFALSTGWQPFTADGRTVLDGDFIEAFRFYANLQQDVGQTVNSLGKRWSGACLADEITSVAIEGNWIAGFLKGVSPNLLYRTARMPMHPTKKTTGNLLFTTSWSVNAQTEYPEITQRVISLLTSPKAQAAVVRSGLAIPSIQDDFSQVINLDTANGQLSDTLMRTATDGNLQPYQFAKYGTEWMDVIHVALTSVFQGKATIDEAIEEAQSKFDLLHARKYAQ